MKLFRYDRTVYEKATAHGVVQVVDRGDQRELRFGNHITQTAISLTAPDVLVLDYARAMVTGLLFPDRLQRILHFGLGGGALPRFIHRHLPAVTQRVVELNPEVIEVAYRYFDLPQSERLEVVTAEGAEFLRAERTRYDLIVLDAFHAEGAVPHLNTRSFFTMIAAHLDSGGWLVNNAWGSDRARLMQVRESQREAFAQLYHLSVRANSNVIFFASQDPRPVQLGRMRRRARALSQRMPLELETLLSRVRADRTPRGTVPAPTGP